MNILIVDQEHCGLDFALRCKAHGHTVRWFLVPDKKRPDSPIGDGLGIQKVKDFAPSMNWADLILMTGNDKYLHHLDRYRNYGFPIFGPSVEAASLEIDRAKGQDLLKQHGIPVIPYETFTNYDKAEAYVRKHGKRYVSKPMGDNADKALSYVSQDPADMIFMLRRWKKLGKNMGQFMLQEFVPGIEFAVSGWMGKDGFLPDKFQENAEFKKLMNDDLGVNTGEQGTVMQYVKKSKLADAVLKPLEQYLISIGYIGDVDINCIIDEKGKAWPLEFTCRLGWPAFWIQCASHLGDPAEWMIDALDGQDSLKVSYEVAIGVVISQPDYPYSHVTQREVLGIPVYGLEGIRKQVAPVQMMQGNAPTMKDGKVVDQDMLVTTGDYICVVSALGETVSEAQKKVYGHIKHLSIPNSIGYRTDIGDRLKKQLVDLHKHGYALDMEF